MKLAGIFKRFGSKKHDNKKSVQNRVVANSSPEIEGSKSVQSTPKKSESNLAESSNNEQNSASELENSTFEKALAHHQQGQLAQAQALYSSILKANPKHADSLHLLGVMCSQTGNHTKAVELISQAISIKTDKAVYFSNLGNAYKQLNKLQDAILNYEKSITIQSDNPDTFANLGATYLNLKNHEKALINLDKSIEIRPNFANTYSDRGNALKALSRLEEAIESYEKAIYLNPNNASFYNNKGNALQLLNRYDESIKCYQQAIALNPQLSNAFNNLGTAQKELNLLDEALKSYSRSIEIDANYAEAHSNKANLLKDVKLVEEAFTHFNNAYRINPNLEFILGSLLYTKHMLCDWSDYDQTINNLREKVLSHEKVSPSFPVLSMIDHPYLQLISAQIWAKSKYEVRNKLASIPKKSPGQRIKIGYYSADYHNHATSYLLAGVFEAHNKDEFECIAFSFGPDKDDEMRERVSSSFDRFIDVRQQSDLEVAQLSRDLGIDIAIDLKGYTQDARPGIFANRCAPIQVSYLGYPGSMGAEFIDYLIADSTLIPQSHLQNYSEKIIYLPGSYQANDSKRVISDKKFTKEELGLPESGFVFCCFNNNYKITPSTFDGWMRILSSVEDSVLWLMEGNSVARENLREEAEKRGVNADRLIFAKHMALSEHLARYKLADLFIDSLPCNAHTTASDALWAGVPVLTLLGESFASRVGGSLLNGIELPELITRSQHEYESKAIELATDRDAYVSIKKKLNENKSRAPLFNSELFASRLEEAYRRITDRYVAGHELDHIYLNPE